MGNSTIATATAVAVISGIVGWLVAKGHKSQMVRLIDVFAIGPILLLIGFKYCSNPLLAYAAIVIGASTIAYNLKNYIVTRRSSS